MEGLQTLIDLKGKDEAFLKQAEQVPVLVHVLIVSDSAAPWTAARWAPLSMEFSSQEHWSGFPFPTSGDSSQPRDQACISRVSCIGRRILNY